jgi:hypothetical protein
MVAASLDRTEFGGWLRWMLLCSRDDVSGLRARGETCGCPECTCLVLFSSC